MDSKKNGGRMAVKWPFIRRFGRFQTDAGRGNDVEMKRLMGAFERLQAGRTRGQGFYFGTAVPPGDFEKIDCQQ